MNTIQKTISPVIIWFLSIFFIAALPFNSTDQTQNQQQDFMKKATAFDEAGNYAEAFKWYKKAAEQGNTDAQCSLGLMYVAGKGVAQNYNEGFR